MPLTTKTRFAKRKLEMTELRKDKHTITSKKLMFCHECECPAEDRYGLGEHMFEFHTERD